LLLVGLSFVFQQDNNPTHLQAGWKISQQVLTICGNSFQAVGNVFQVKLVERMPRVCKPVIKAKGGY
jgi:hypothetical protein